VVDNPGCPHAYRGAKPTCSYARVGKSASTGAVRPVRPPGWWRVTTDAGAGAAPTPVDVDDGSGEEYDEMLESLDVAIGEARRKVESGRVRWPENERVRTKWIRTLAYAVNVRRQVTADRDLQELGERIERLEEREGIDV